MTNNVWTMFARTDETVKVVLRFRTRSEAREASKGYREASEDPRRVSTVVTRTNSRTAGRLTAAHHHYLVAKAEMARMAEARTRKGRRMMKLQKPVTLELGL